MKMKRQTISDNVSAFLRDQILRQKLKSGDRIVESQIAKDLGVSQAPVREALLELEGMGLVEIKPYVGCYVLPYNSDILDQAYELRSILESYAAAYAVEYLEEEKIAIMEGIIQEMREFLKIDDRKSIFDKDFTFHEIIINSVGNPMLQKMWRMASIPWSNVTITYVDDMNYIVESHVKILEYLRAKNADALKDELSRHFDNARVIARHAFEDNHE